MLEMIELLLISIQQYYYYSLILYFDDFEINSPIGTHCCFHKIGALKFSLYCPADEYASQLEYIFLVQFQNTVEYDNCDNEKLF